MWCERVISTALKNYRLEEQIGFILRKVRQRHVAIFAEQVGSDLTPTQWTVMMKLSEVGKCSQNRLGRMTAMDIATIKGVIDRLTARGLTEISPDPEDGRRLLIGLTASGRAQVESLEMRALLASEKTLAPLSVKERKTLAALLRRLRRCPHVA